MNKTEAIKTIQTAPWGVEPRDWTIPENGGLQGGDAWEKWVEGVSGSELRSALGEVVAFTSTHLEFRAIIAHMEDRVGGCVATVYATGPIRRRVTSVPPPTTCGDA